MDEIKLFSMALQIYKEFFGKMPDLQKKSDVNELHAIYSDLCHTNQNMAQRNKSTK